MPQPTEPTYLRPALAVAGVSTFVGLLVTCTFVLLGWGSGGADSVRGVVTGGVRAWLVSHGSGITIDGIAINAIPLGAVAVAIAVVAWATGKVLDEPTEAEPLEEVVPFVAVTAGVYGVVAALLSVAANSEDVSTGMIRSTLGAVIVAAAGAALGAARANGGLSTLWFTDNVDVRAVVPAAWSGLMALLASSFVLFIILFAFHVDRAGDLWAALDPGALGGITLAAGCALLLPNLVLWTASTLIGPGFALGTSTSVDLSGAHLGAVPSLPLFAALPGPGEFPGWIFLLGLVPLLAGVIAGWNVKTGEGRPLLERALLGLAAGALAGLVCGILIAVSGGAIGPGRMAEAGPPHYTPALVAIGILGLGGAIGAVLGHYRVARAHNSPTGRPRLRLRHKSASPD